MANEKGLSHKYEIGDEYIHNKKKYRVVGVYIQNVKDKDRSNKRFKVCYKVYCYDCGGIFTIDNSHIGKRGCPICCGSCVYEGINDITTTASWMIPYFLGGYDEAKKYTKGSNKNIQMVCPTCGELSRKLISPNRLYSTHSIGCVCNGGIKYPERFMCSLLTQLNINFIFHARESDVGFKTDKEYDFFIKEKNLIIETHGGQHYKSNSWASYESTHENDIIKKKDAILNGIRNYIEIDCRKSNMIWIKKSIMESILPEVLYFKENDVNWKQCDENAQQNIIKEVCDYYNSVYMKVSDIAEHFSLHVDTIDKYLKKGNELGWCNYTTDNNAKYPCVVIFKNNSSIIAVKNVQYLANNSEYILNQQLKARMIIKCLSGEKHSYHGYKFKYCREPADMCWEINKKGFIELNGGGYNGYFEFTVS